MAGNPNVGKTTVFNALTGLHQHVGNWPGKTVERKEGHYLRPGLELSVVDLPGAYSLSCHSAEEVVARDFILHEQPDVVVVVVDASSIERNLYLLAQVLELTNRVVVALTMLDLAETKGYQVRPGRLARALGVPVVALRSRSAQELEKLTRTVAAVGHGKTVPEPRPIDYLAAAPTIGELAAILPPHMECGSLLPLSHPAEPGGVAPGDPVCSRQPSWLALKLLEGDDEVTSQLHKVLDAAAWQSVEAVLGRHEHEPAVLADARYAWIAEVLAEGMTRPARSVVTLTDRIDHAATHRYLGLPILLAVFGGIFWLTFAVARPLASLIDLGTGWLGGMLSAQVAPAWLGRLLGEGVVPGVGGVLTFLPTLLIFFLLLGALEESGYMARAAFAMDNLMHALGLHGKAFLPLVVGFGCNVPGVMAARILEHRRDRLLVTLLNSLIPCPARMGVAAFLVAAFFPQPWQPVVMLGLYALSLGMVLAAGLLLRRTVLPGEQTPLMMELPLYRLPSGRGLLLNLGWRLRAFLRKAGTIILATSALIWLLSTYPAGGGPMHTYLGQLGTLLSPMGRLLGFDGRLLVALLTGFAAKENALAALGVLYNSSGAGLAAALRASITPLVGLVFVIVQLLYVPCLATVAVIRAETGSRAWTALAVIYPLVLATGLGIVVYQVGRMLGF